MSDQTFHILPTDLEANNVAEFVEEYRGKMVAIRENT